MRERIANLLCWAAIFLAGSGMASIIIATPVQGHDLPGIPQANQSWYQNAETNEEARNTFPHPWVKCCNHAEVIPVKDIIFPTDDHGWQWNDQGTIKSIPDIVIHWDAAAPDNQPTLFVYSGVMTCFYPPQGGV